MNKDEAVHLLAGVRAGLMGDVNPEAIADALRATGDIPALSWPERTSRASLDRAAWIQCRWCAEVYCRIHGLHAHECACPPIEEWDCDPYLAGAGRTP
jgi:hypothetical protein